jgi:CHRD domain
MRRFLTFATLALVALGASGGSAHAQVPDLLAGRTFTIPLAPGAAGGGGSGTATITLNPGLEQVCYEIEVTLLPGDQPAEPPGSGLGPAHIHLRASGAVVLGLVHENEGFQPTNGGFVATGCVEAERELILAILRNPEAYYVNVHSVFFPAGAVEGTLVDRTAPTISLAVAGQRLSMVRSAGLQARVGCSEACTLKVDVLLATAKARKLGLRALVGRGATRLSHSGETPLALKLRSTARRKLSTVRSVTFTVRVTATDAAGNSSRAARAASLGR